MREFIQQNNIDIYMVAEVNVNWCIVGKRNSIWDIARQWFERQKVSASYNQRDRSCKQYQPGGTAVICREETAMRAIAAGQDPKRLGRWSWTLLRGKENKLTRVVSVYVPCIARTFGCRKVYCQQQKALLKMGKVGSVLKVFWEDLWSQVDTWREEGNQLIMAGDWNTDVQNKEFLQPFLERSMVPAITHQHGTQGPETFSGGSMPIDEIFCSSSLQVQAAGYLQHGQATGDHRPIWIDVTTDSFLGADRQPLPSYKARRLKCQDPRIVVKYNTVCSNLLQTTATINHVQELTTVPSRSIHHHHCKGQHCFKKKSARDYDLVPFYFLHLHNKNVFNLRCDAPRVSEHELNNAIEARLRSFFDYL
jgi:hypothetical protein